ncbi:MAG: hypothetical protein DRO15_04295 [Thermoprotei archaeon]|nr:MAG: hypothetical protein DRO15_04295 [Thermoprotei archaeon]
MDRDVLIYALLLTMVMIALVLVGESRPDVYLSITILMYFIYTSINYSIRSRARLRILDAILLFVFLAIVTYRVLEVLRVI